MKNILAILVLIVLSFSTIADEKHDFCSVIAEHSEVVMKARQNGVAADEAYNMYKRFEKDFQDPKQAMVMARLFIMDAYNEPKFLSDEAIERAITEFRNEAYIKCLEAVND